jgi:hypothetical protein
MAQTKKQLKNTIKQLKQNKKKQNKRTKLSQQVRRRRLRVPAGYGNTVAGTLSKLKFSGTERLADLTNANANGNFRTDTYLFSPTTLPWLAKIAALYDKYRFTKLVIRYVNACGTNTPGEVNLSFDFDPKDPAPTSMQQCCNMAVYKSTSAFRNAALSVPVKSASNFVWRFTRDGHETEGRIVDTGNLHVSTAGFTESIRPGALYVDYEVELTDKSTF